jgi:hypothetical protein
MKEVTVVIFDGVSEETHTLCLDEIGYAKLITGYVLEGYKVQRVNPNGRGILATKGKEIHGIKLGE